MITDTRIASSEGLANAVTVSNIMGHLREFYKISQKPGNGGSRSVLGGYMDSLNYVRNQLKATGCTVRTRARSELEKSPWSLGRSHRFWPYFTFFCADTSLTRVPTPLLSIALN